MFLPSNIQLIGAGLGLLGAFSVGCYATHKIDASRLQEALASQQATLTQQCNEQKKITEDANASYQSQIGIITAKLNKYRMRQSKCVVVQNDSTNLSSGGAKYAGSNGLSAGWLREFAAECETYRAQRITWDKWVADQK